MRDISLQLHAGDRVVLRGESGAGKTLLLRALARLDACHGTLLWRGKEIPSAEVPVFRSQVVFLQQRPSLIEGTVHDILREPFHWKSYESRSFHQQHVVRLFQAVGRDAEFLHKRHSDLSSGEAALVGLIRAMQLEPTVLLLDEPTSALDETTTKLVEALVDRWFQAGDRAYVWVSHDPAQAKRMAQRSITMAKRQLVKTTPDS